MLKDCRKELIDVTLGQSLFREWSSIHNNEASKEDYKFSSFKTLQRKPLKIGKREFILGNKNQTESLFDWLKDNYNLDTSLSKEISSITQNLLESRKEIDKLTDQLTPDSLSKLSLENNDSYLITHHNQSFDEQDDKLQLNNENNSKSKNLLSNKKKMKQILKKHSNDIAKKFAFEIQTLLKEIDHEQINLELINLNYSKENGIRKSDKHILENQKQDNEQIVEYHEDSKFTSVNQLTSDLVQLTSELKQRSIAIKDRIDEDNPLIDKQIELQNKNIENSKTEIKSLREHTNSIRWTLFEQFSSLILGAALFFFITLIIQFFAKH